MELEEEIEIIEIDENEDLESIALQTLLKGEGEDIPQHIKNITEQDIEKWNNNSGGGGINEIYVGEYEPTDEDVELWIDPTEEAEEYAKKKDIPDVSNFITEDVGKLTNFYNKDSIDNMIGDIEMLLGGI